MSSAAAWRRWRHLGWRGATIALSLVCSCTVGPNFNPPPAPTASAWLESQQPGTSTGPATSVRWWEVFGDDVLDRLVDTAYGENLSLKSAGLRVLEAQARRGIAIGELFPQRQELNASFARSGLSENTRLGSSGPRTENQWRAGFDAAWELDLWGRFRRGIEAADADLLASVASYDDVLVSLIAEVAATYVRLRVLDERLAVAANNVRVQQDSLDIARVRAEAGGTSDLDVEQATSLLKDTESTIPELGIESRQTMHSLCVLLGRPPGDLGGMLGENGHVPKIPPTVAVGIPADLLRRRPDVRRAEQAAAAQSARIGVSVADLLPSLQLIGSVGFEAEDIDKLAEGRALSTSFGPAIRWPILNYGRLVNDVRLQDATFQELLANYSQTVLVAQQEVEDALIGYLRGTEQLERLAESVAAASRAVELSLIQYREGATDFTSVLNTQQVKIRQEDLLATTRGSVALSVIALYKALGGGWEIGEGRDRVSPTDRAALSERGYWPTAPQTLQPSVESAAQDTAPRPWWKPRWWWPQW
jgi:NodT family efflux transporter outer membrane factor (OMF) lipoprotein